MSDRTLKITAAYLRDAGMSDHAVAYFYQWFPEGVTIDEEFARRESRSFAWTWMIHHLLTEREIRDIVAKELREADAERMRAYVELDDWWEASSKEHALVKSYNGRSDEIDRAGRLRVALAFVAGFTQQGGRPLAEGETP